MNHLYIYGNNKEEEKIHDMNRSERVSASCFGVLDVDELGRWTGLEPRAWRGQGSS